MVRKKSRFLWS